MQILEKIEVLRNDPKPHGSLKKKLHGYKGDIYRLRSGDYRIIYTYGDGWVALLGVDARKDIYKGDKLIAETTEIDVTAFADLDELLTPEKAPAIALQSSPAEILPVELTAELLERLLIPKACFAALLGCRTFDDLLLANIPDAVRNRLFDCITAPNFDRVLDQPSFVTGDADALLRFKEGDLLGFLLKLNPEQEKFVTWAIKASGPTLLKGSPGTGKSTVALYRTREILQQLQANGVHRPRILFTTYTNALVTFSEQLLQQLLGNNVQFVEVKTADALMYAQVCAATGQPKIATNKDLLKLIRQAIGDAIATLEGNVLQQQAQRLTLQRLQPEYLLEELTEVIDARGIDTLEAYQATPRIGRSIPLNKIQRQAIWNLRQHCNRAIASQGIETWAQLRSRALSIWQSQPTLLYDAVIVDEAQDLSPVALRFLVQLCREPNRLFVTADANQSIYGSSFRWSEVHQSLSFVGRTGILKINHRTTKEIAEAAHSYLQEGKLDEDDIQQQYIHTGPSPAVRAVSDRAAEGELLAQFCRTAAREFRLGLSACAILVPTEKIGKNIAGQLSYLGIAAQFMTSKDLNLNYNGVKVLPIKAAKGLEFPIVAIAGFLDSYSAIPKGTPMEASAEILTRERRSLYVAMTRAMRALLVIVPAQQPSLLLQNFAPHLWNLV
ncbi:UvrD-helicase domain-containing protein [Gloeocapsopsis crepidinum]